MVAAIVIPIICFYFFWITRREMREQDKKWLHAGNVPHEAVLTGEIKDVVEEKQRFYYHRHIFVQEIKLQTEHKLVMVKKITPLTKNMNVEQFTAGETIRIYGMWEGSTFIFDDYKVIQ